MIGVDLYWLPLGAGGHSVRLNGLVFEAIAARLHHRDRSDLYHAGLELYVPEGRLVIEQAPAWGERGERGVVAEQARRLLELVPEAPTPVWGRDELGGGEMWNSNSLISWLIVRAGLDVESIHPPAGGRAPGWRAGIVIAQRSAASPR